MKINKVGIIGMGALGILFGEFLTEKIGKENVCFVANKNRIEKYNEQGIFSNGKFCDFNLIDEDQGEEVDLLIFAVKFTVLEEAIKSARNMISDNTIIISLLNGISSEGIIGETFGMEKIIYCVAQGMDPVKLGNKLTYTNLGQLCIGIPYDEEYKRHKLNLLVEFFEGIEFPHTVEEDINHRLWSKFMLNVGVNQVVMIYEGNYGIIHKEGEARELMKNAMREVITLGNLENINLSERDLEEYVALIDTLDPEGMPSMRQDGLHKRKSEVELFSGTVLALGKKHGVDTPINKKIYEIVREMESRY